MFLFYHRNAELVLCSVLLAAYSEFRSLLLFKAATFGGALMDPVAAWQSPLMHAYAYYIRINLRGSILRSRKSEIYLALALCNSMDEGMSQPLVDALHSHWKKVVYSIRRNLPTGPMSDVSCVQTVPGAVLL
jgi:hypothetical protein